MFSIGRLAIETSIKNLMKINPFTATGRIYVAPYSRPVPYSRHPPYSRHIFNDAHEMIASELFSL